MKRNNYATHWRQAAARPSGIAGELRSILRDSFLSVSAFVNRSADGSYLRCLYCHYVFDDQREHFEHLITQLTRIGEFIDTDTCVRMLKGETPIDRRYYHLSFDDGFRNNFINALPILRKYNVPAIFFVPSSLIEASWKATENYCLNTTRYQAVIEMLKWDDLRDMISNGYQIGSHTKTHARFSAISNAPLVLEDEILGSKRELEDKLNFECKYISWPFGRLTDADGESLIAVKNAGYTACFGAFRGTVLPGSTDIFRIPRHHFEAQWPISHIKYFARGNMEVKE